MSWKRRHLLGLRDLSAEEIEFILQTAEPFRDIFNRPIKKFPTLRGQVIVNLFYEPSTRTRTSFELAGKWLSADVVNIAVSTSSVTKGESLLDTARTLDALGADQVVVRHSSAGVPHLLARHVRAAVINAGDGANEHPTQALLDLLTIRTLRGSVAGRHVLIVGDVLHSRVARSNVYALTRLGARVTLVGPPSLMPPSVEGWGVEVRQDLDRLLPQADVVYMLRIQKERHAEGGWIPGVQEYRRRFGLTADRLKRLRDDALIMHPGPANVGVEIDAEVLNDPRCAVLDQVSNGVAVRMAVLYLLSGGKPSAVVG